MVRLSDEFPPGEPEAIPAALGTFATASAGTALASGICSSRSSCASCTCGSGTGVATCIAASVAASTTTW